MIMKTITGKGVNKCLKVFIKDQILGIKTHLRNLYHKHIYYAMSHTS